MVKKAKLELRKIERYVLADSEWVYFTDYDGQEDEFDTIERAREERDKLLESGDEYGPIEDVIILHEVREEVR